MADTYDVIGVIPTQELVNGAQLQDWIELTCVSKPNGVTFSVKVPKTPGWKDAIQAAAASEAAELESAFAF